MTSVVINSEEYSLIVLRVTEKDAYGRPRHCETLYDEEVVDLRDGKPKEFITAFVKSRVVEKESAGHA